MTELRCPRCGRVATLVEQRNGLHAVPTTTVRTCGHELDGEQAHTINTQIRRKVPHWPVPAVHGIDRLEVVGLPGPSDVRRGARFDLMIIDDPTPPALPQPGAKRWSEPIPIYSDPAAAYATAAQRFEAVLDDLVLGRLPIAPDRRAPVRYLDHLVSEATKIRYDEDGMFATMVLDGQPVARIRNSDGPITAADVSDVRPVRRPAPAVSLTTPVEQFRNRKARRHPPKESRR